MNLKDIVDKIEASKEVLATMPKNNPKNIKIYKEKIEELQEEYKEYQKEIHLRLQRRYQNATKKVPNSEIENLEKRLKTISYILDLLDEEKTSYEKMGLDRAIFTISRYYKENLDHINEQIQSCIKMFSTVGIQVSVNDFDYSIYVKDYMRVFFQELEKGIINSEILKEKFEEIYWKCPDIIVHIELNIRNIYLKKEQLIDKFFEKEKVEKLKRLDVTSKEVKKNYLDLKRQLIDKKAVDAWDMQDKFLNGKLNVKNFTKEKIDADINKVLPKEIGDKVYESEEIQGNISRFLNTLYEYQNYMKFKFIVDDVKQYYQQKENYKKSYMLTKKEIEKLEGKLKRLNKKSTKRGLFGTIKIENKQLPEAKELIQVIRVKYKELDMNKFYNKIYEKLDKNCTVYDALNLANSYYVYLTSCIINNFKNIQHEEINDKVKELNDFLNNPYNNFISHTRITDESDLTLIIKDRYKLLNFNVEKDDFTGNNINSLISRLENIQMAINMKRANLKIEDVEQLCEIKKVLQ